VVAAGESDVIPASKGKKRSGGGGQGSLFE